MQASGRLAFAPELALDLRGTWSGAAMAVAGSAPGEQRIGPLAVRGTLDEYVLSLDANVAMAEGEQGRVRVAGTGSTQALRFDQIEIDALQEKVVGRGELTWRPQLGGAIELSGRLRDRPIEASARGEYSAETLRLETLSLQAGATRDRRERHGRPRRCHAMAHRQPRSRRFVAELLRPTLGQRQARRSADAAAGHRRRARPSSGVDGLGGRRARIDGGHRCRGASAVAAQSVAACRRSAGQRDTAARIDRHGERRAS